MPSTSSPRLRILRPLDDIPHRYRVIRRATQAFTLGVLFAVPLAGFARLDLWDGRHLIFGKATNEVYGLGGVLLGVLAFYFVTFIINAFLGRVFCGFGCPVGELSRLSDGADVAAKAKRGRLVAEGRAVLYALALACAGELWLVSPRVFVEGSPRAIAWAVGGLVSFAAILYAHGRFGRWSFCRHYCPIGVYYSAVQTEHGFGIHFDATDGRCKGCSVCEKVCPVELDPRELGVPREGMRGIGIDGFPGRNHCLSCGDCVRACEHAFRDRDRALVPLRLSFGGPEAKPRASAPKLEGACDGGASLSGGAADP